MSDPASSVILMVEDDDSQRQLIMDSLERQEHWVLCARNGGEARGLCKEHGSIIGLLLTSVALPDMDGSELSSRVRDLPLDLPVLYMAREDQLSDAVREGVTQTGNSYLIKRFDHDYLLLKVRAALKG